LKWTSWAFLAFVGSLIFLVLFVTDQRINNGVNRLSHYKFPPHSALGPVSKPLLLIRALSTALDVQERERVVIVWKGAGAAIWDPSKLAR
jgi:hypothetical protein